MTAGVARLFAEALLDLLLLPPRIALAIVCAGRRKRAIADLIRQKSLHAPQDAHPPR